jgi:uncharacterized protein
MNVFIIHGAYGNPKENWFSWLKSELESLNHKVIIPEFPTPNEQELAKWTNNFQKYKCEINSETILIGHSLGSAFILSILETLNTPVKACFFIAGFIGLLNNKKFDSINKTFTAKDFDWDKIKKNCNKFILFNSKDDPYVPLKKGQELSNILNGELIIKENAGHFNKDAGFTSFKELLTKINELI